MMASSDRTPGRRPDSTKKSGRRKSPGKKPAVSKPPGGKSPDSKPPGKKPPGKKPPDRPPIDDTIHKIGGLGPVTIEDFTVPDRFPVDLPVDLGDLRLEFAALDQRLPLLLLPIRLETKYRLDLNPPELRIRIYPEQVHIETEAGEPTENDVELARTYWEQVEETKNPARRRALWRAFARTVGPNRAGHIARVSRPRSVAGKLVFPDVKTRSGQRPARPVLLPDRWVIHGYRGDAQVFNVASNRIAPDLQVSPDAAELGVKVGASGLQVSPGMAWMVDYDAAVEAGMAVTVDLDKVDNPEVPFSAVLAFGIHSTDDPQALGDEFEEVLAMHQRTSGLAFVPAGTPTNNTPEVEAGWTRAERELDDLADRELPGPTRAGFPGLPGRIGPSNARRLSDVLGFADHAVLERSAFGTDDERGRSAAMNRALFEPMLGRYLRNMLAIDDVPILDDAAIADAGVYFAEKVTGGAHYPTLRVGPQPYGILPMTLPGPGRHDTETLWVKAITEYVRPEWRAAVDAVPTLDPDATDALDDGEPVDALPAVLASLPHPARIFGRTFYADDDDAFGSILGLENLYRWSIDDVLPLLYPNFKAVTDFWGYSGPNDQMASLASIDEQINAWAVMGDMLAAGDFADIDDDERDGAIAFVNGLMVMLESYELRQRPHRFLDIPGWTGILGFAAHELISGRFDQNSDEWSSPAIVGRPDAPDDHQPAAYLADLAARLEGNGPIPPASMPADFLARPPLLYQVIDSSLGLLDGTARSETRSAIEALAAEEPTEIERLFRETLGLVTYRLDAWTTAVARRRIDGMRETDPRGLQIGAFGWVLDLAPSDGRVSNGFVHAPSLTHAATASVLRAAWLANGDAAPDSPAAVNVDSRRLRMASWILEGVRNGQPLGELLGYRFERGLHDAGLAGEILDIRLAVIGALGDGDAGEDEAVDGLELLRLWRDGDLDSYLDGLKNNLRTAIEGHLEGIDEAFDAVADAALFEGTHQLIQGNSERASAMFDAVSLGTGSPPELLAANTGRDGTTIDHRVVLLLDGDVASSAGSGWVPGIRDRLCPPLERWIQQLLPAPSDVGVVVSDGANWIETTLAAGDFSATDAVLGDRSALLAVLRERLGLLAMARIEMTERGAAPFSFDEFEITAREVRALLADAAPGDSHVLFPPLVEVDPVADYKAVDLAVQDLFQDFAAAVGAGPADADWETLARFGWTAGRDAVNSHASIAARLSAAKDLDGDGRPRPGEERIAAMIAQAPPLLPRFVVTAEQVMPVDGLAAPNEVVDWLDAIGRVRPAIGRLTTAGLLAGLADAPGYGLAAGQTSRSAGESWAALHRPPGDSGDRLCITAVGLKDSRPGVGDEVVALLLDQWSERIPNSDQVTGVGFHFDAPSNRPPQAWLLVAPETGRSWSEEAVAELLFETLDWVTMRMVGPEDLRSYGHGLPTAYAGRRLQTWPEEEAT